MQKITILLYFIIIINILSFLAFGIDKRKAKKGQWRIKESTLFLLSIFGGSLGAMLGMKVFHHKTKHKSFTFFIPAIFIIEALILLLSLKFMF